MNEKTTVSGDEASLSIGTLLENMDGSSFMGILRERCRRKLSDGCLSLYGPLGEPEESHDWEF
jgi:hypothetical protein